MSSFSSGGPSLLRDSRTARNTFRLPNHYWDGVPKPKFLFYLRFMRSNNPNTAPSVSTGTSSSNFDWTRGVGLVIKTVDRPKVSFDVETVNQYNKKRVIQKRVEYGPITIRFHDTVDNKAYHLFEEYFRFYYGDARNTSFNDWSWDIMANEFKKNAGSWGFTPPSVEPNFSYFFSHVEVYQLFGGKYNRYDLINPKIVSFDPDELDFTNGGIGHELTMTMAFEGIVYQGNNLDLKNASGLLQEMGLDASGFLDVDGGAGDTSVGISNTFGSNSSTNYGFDGVESLLSPFNLTGRSSSFSASQPRTATDFTSVLGTLLQQAQPGLLGNPEPVTNIIGSNIAQRLVSGLK